MKIRWSQRLHRVALGFAGLLLLFCCYPLQGQPAPQNQQTAQPPRKPEDLPPPQTGNQNAGRRSAADATAEAASCGMGQVMPISLPVALKLALTTNLDIAQAREFVAASDAALTRAKVAWVPNFNIGSTYIHHEGMIQNTAGPVIKVNRDSLFAGGGPSVNFSVSEVIFLPLAARQVLVATEAGLVRVTNDTLLQVAEAYFALMRARRRLARVDETIEFLTSPRSSPSRSGSKGMLPLMLDFYRAGGSEALLAEVERVRVEVLGRRDERVGAIEDMQVASAELARLIRLDPAVMLWPVEDFRCPIELPGAEWLGRPVEDLAAQALNNRPELAENRALAEAALARVKTAKWRPLLPNLVSSYNWGNFGGGPDTNPPIIRGTTVINQPGMGPSGQIHHMNTRTDWDVSLVWRLNNLGFGNRAEVRQTQADYRRQEQRYLQVQDLVVTQAVQAYQLSRGWRDRVEITRSALFDQNGVGNGPVFQSLRLNFERIRLVPTTRALEVLDSIRGLNALLDQYGNDVTDYERARFRLLIALGMQPNVLVNLICTPAGEHAPAPPKAPNGPNGPNPK
jgi:outer membrane protein TolC